MIKVELKKRNHFTSYNWFLFVVSTFGFVFCALISEEFKVGDIVLFIALAFNIIYAGMELFKIKKN